MIYLQKDWLNKVMTYDFKVFPVQQMSDISLLSGEKIVKAEHLRTCLYQLITQMTAQKARSSCHKNP